MKLIILLLVAVGCRASYEELKQEESAEEGEEASVLETFLTTVKEGVSMALNWMTEDPMLAGFAPLESLTLHRNIQQLKSSSPTKATPPKTKTPEPPITTIGQAVFIIADAIVTVLERRDVQDIRSGDKDDFECLQEILQPRCRRERLLRRVYEETLVITPHNSTEPKTLRNFLHTTRTHWLDVLLFLWPQHYSRHVVDAWQTKTQRVDMSEELAPTQVHCIFTAVRITALLIVEQRSPNVARALWVNQRLHEELPGSDNRAVRGQLGDYVMRRLQRQGFSRAVCGLQWRHSHQESTIALATSQVVNPFNSVFPLHVHFGPRTARLGKHERAEQMIRVARQYMDTTTAPAEASNQWLYLLALPGWSKQIPTPWLTNAFYKLDDEALVTRILHIVRAINKDNREEWERVEGIARKEFDARKWTFGMKTGTGEEGLEGGIEVVLPCANRSNELQLGLKDGSLVGKVTAGTILVVYRFSTSDSSSSFHSSTSSASSSSTTYSTTSTPVSTKPSPPFSVPRQATVTTYEYERDTTGLRVQNARPGDYVVVVKPERSRIVFEQWLVKADAADPAFLYNLLLASIEHEGNDVIVFQVL